MFDTVAAYLTFAEKWCEIETIDLRVDDKGMLIRDDEAGRPVRCAMRWRDRDAFEELLVASLTGSPSQ